MLTPHGEYVAMTPQKLTALRGALAAAEAEVARLTAEVATAEEELRRQAEEARQRAEEKREAEEALAQRVGEHFEHQPGGLESELAEEPRRLRDESLLRWALRQVRATGSLGYVFTQLPERLHAELERRYEHERAEWEAAPPARSASPGYMAPDGADLAGEEQELEERVAKHFAEVGHE